MPTQTGSFDFKAGNEASKTATTYLTDFGDGGLWVTPSNAKPSNGAAISTTRGWHIASALEYFVGTATYFRLWFDSTLNKMRMRLGLGTSGHVLIDDSGMEVRTNASTSVAKFGESSRIGRDDANHVEIDGLGISELDEDGDVFFTARDLRSEVDGSTQYGLFTEVFHAGQNQLTYSLTLELYDMGLVLVDGTDIPPSSEFYNGLTYGQDYKSVTFPSGYVTISAGSKVSIAYYTADPSLKAMGFGSGIHDYDLGPLSTALGDGTAARGYAAFAQGKDSTASGAHSMAGGEGSEASAESSHAEGYMTEASDRYAHSEGRETLAVGPAAHAEGWGTEAGVKRSYNYGCHAEGYCTKATGGYGAHAEGNHCTAHGVGAHAEGIGTEADGRAAHAGGYFTKASSDYQTAIGKYNVEDDQGEYAFIVGNGDSAARRNALAVKWDGSIVLDDDTTVKPSTDTATSGILTAGTNISVVTQQIAVWGKVATLICCLKPTAAISAAATVATVNAGYRPAVEVFMLGNVADKDAYLASGGALKTRSGLSSGSYYYFSATYVLA